MDMPVKYINVIAKITLIGIEIAITNVGLMSFRKISSTIIASKAPITRFVSTELIT